MCIRDSDRTESFGDWRMKWKNRNIAYFFRQFTMSGQEMFMFVFSSTNPGQIWTIFHQLTNGHQHFIEQSYVWLFYFNIFENKRKQQQIRSKRLLWRSSAFLCERKHLKNVGHDFSGSDGKAFLTTKPRETKSQELYNACLLYTSPSPRD